MVNLIECKHYWQIDSDNKGVCRNCGEIRQFPNGGKGEVKILKEGIVTIDMLAPAIAKRHHELNPPPEESKPPQTHLKTSYRGRPPTGEHRLCKGCGKPIYVRAYRIKKGGGNYCQQCNKREQATSILSALKGLAVHSSRFTPSEMLGRTESIVAKYLEKEPQRTIADLINSPTFTEDDLLWNAFSIVIEQTLKLDERFEEVGNGIYRLKAHRKTGSEGEH